MLPYLPEPADGLEFSFKISNDRTKLKVFVRNTSAKTVSIMSPVEDPMEQEFKLLKQSRRKPVSGIISCFPTSKFCSSLQIASRDVEESYTGFGFIGQKPGTYSGKLTFYNPASQQYWRPTEEPVQPVDMRSVRFLVRVYPSGKYKLLKIVD